MITDRFGRTGLQLANQSFLSFIYWSCLEQTETVLSNVSIWQLLNKWLARPSFSRKNLPKGFLPDINDYFMKLYSKIFSLEIYKALLEKRLKLWHLDISVAKIGTKISTGIRKTNLQEKDKWITNEYDRISVGLWNCFFILFYPFFNSN